MIHNFIRLTAVRVFFVLGAFTLPDLATAQAPASPQEVLVYIVAQDSQAFHPENTDQAIATLRRLFPAKRIALVNELFQEETRSLATIYRTRGEGSAGADSLRSRIEERRLREERRVRASLRFQLIELLEPGEIITHLVIAAHGSTHDVDGVPTSSLGYLGSFNPNGLSEDLSSILEPIQGHVARDATVVLESCKALCGASDGAAARAESLLNFLGATDGTLYGSETYEMVNEFISWPNARNLSLHMRNWTRALRFAVIAGAASLAVTTPIALGRSLLNDDPLDFFVQRMIPLLASVTYNSALTAAVSGAGAIVLAPTVSRALAELRIVNRGRQFFLRDGRVDEVRPASRLPGRLGAIFSPRACYHFFRTRRYR